MYSPHLYVNISILYLNNIKINIKEFEIDNLTANTVTSFNNKTLTSECYGVNRHTLLFFYCYFPSLTIVDNAWIIKINNNRQRVENNIRISYLFTLSV